MDGKKIRESQMGEIESFWAFVQEHKEDVFVDFYDEEHFYLYLPFDHGILNAFTDQYQYYCEETGCPCKIGMSGICIHVNEIEGGYGFTMANLWENRPDGIENGLGKNFW